MARLCIFCGNEGQLSKEHIWPEWMRGYLPLIGDGKYKTWSETFKWKDLLNTKSNTRPGHLTTKKVRVVCKSCNNGWMSTLESEAKHVIVRILQRQAFRIVATDQLILSQWITLKTIVGEHVEPDLYVTPKEDRRKFFESRIIPDFFAIYIGSHSSRSDSAWLRISNTLASSASGPLPQLVEAKRNTQSVSFICGPLFIFVLAIREDGINPTEFMSLKKVVRIFPSLSADIDWPPKNVLTERDMGQIAYALDELKNMDNVKYLGDLP